MPRTPLLALAALSSVTPLMAASADGSAVRKVVDALPTLQVKGSLSQAVPVPGAFTANEVGQVCGDPKALFVPLAEVRLGAKEWVVSLDEPSFTPYLSSLNECFEPLDGKKLLNGGSYLLWARTQVAPKRQTVQVDIHPLPAAPAVEISLGDDLGAAVVQRIQLSPEKAQLHGQPVVIKANLKHDLRVYALGAHAGITRQHSPIVSETVRPSQPLSFEVFGDPGATLTLVVIEPRHTVATERDIYGKPTGSTFEERDLSRYSFIPDTYAFNQVTPEYADLAGRLFASIDPAFIVYASAERHQNCILVAGEPLLVLNNRGDVLHANGLRESCGRDPAGDYLTVTVPAKLGLPKIIEPKDDKTRPFWNDEDFLAQAESDKQIASYKKAKESTKKCSDQEWARLDPDGKADHYDIVTYHNGEVAKVEGYAERLGRQVDAKCHVTPLEKQRDAIYARLSKTFDAVEKQRLDAVAKHLAP